MPAFEAAAAAGIPGIELDVRLSRDGVPVVVHDPDLIRLAGVDASIDRLTAGELRSADVGSWFSPRFAGAGVPALDDVFAAFGAGFYYDVEIKHRRGDPTDLIDAVLAVVSRRQLEHRVLISAFHPGVVSQVRRSTEAIPVALIYSAHREVPLSLRRGQGRYVAMPDVLKPHWAELTRPSARILGRLDRRPRIVWTVDGTEALDALEGKRFEGIISNDPPAAQKRWVAG